MPYNSGTHFGHLNMPSTVEIITKIAKECAASWPGAEGANRAMRVQELLDRVLPEYAFVLGLTPDEVLAAIEAKRDYSAVNYYQDANFPSLQGVKVFDTPEAFKAAYPYGRYVCPACAGHSTDPYECNAGTVRDGKRCDWKSYGLFGTMGKGLRAVVKSTFLDAPRVHEIFMPVEAATGSAG
jgi:hypothetical protein